jgi:hypothetical protein
MQPSFEGVAITNTLGLQTSLMVYLGGWLHFLNIQNSHSFLFRQGGKAMVD